MVWWSTINKNPMPKPPNLTRQEVKPFIQPNTFLHIFFLLAPVKDTILNILFKAFDDDIILLQFPENMKKCCSSIVFLWYYITWNIIFHLMNIMNQEKTVFLLCKKICSKIFNSKHRCLPYRILKLEII